MLLEPGPQDCFFGFFWIPEVTGCDLPTEVDLCPESIRSASALGEFQGATGRRWYFRKKWRTQMRTDVYWILDTAKIETNTHLK